MTDMTRPTRPDLSCDDVRELAASFVLGALDADEADAVRAHLASCADPHAEMAERGSVLNVLAESVPVVEPPAALKGRILAAAAADLEARGRGRWPRRRGARRLAPETRRVPAAPTAFPTAAERQQRAADRPASRRGRCGSRPCWRSPCSAGGACCSRTSSTRREATNRASRPCSTWPASRAP